MLKFTKHLVALASAVALMVQSASAVPDQSDPKSKQRGPNIIRDAEIEGLLRLMAKPVFKAAGINAGSVQVVLIGDPEINAFVAGGQRIFVNSGVITKTKSPNQVIGVLAHESGHIAGGHLAKLQNELENASTQSIIGTVFGVAAMVGGALAGSPDAAKAGTGIIVGSQTAAQRGLLVYQRSMEATADESALRYLQATGQSAKGMLDLFQTMGNEALASTRGADPYAYSHPMPFDRLRTMQATAQASQYYNKPDDAGMVLRYDLAKAKLFGFLQPQIAFQKYPSSNNSLAARYARAIALFRRGDLKNALPLLNGLTDELPQNPYFWELKAQAYLENGQANLGLPAIKRARAILPNNGLLQILHAQVLLGGDNPANANEAINLLNLAKRTEPNEPGVFRFMAQAYGLQNKIPEATLATAEFAYATGDKKLAAEKATVAQKYLKKGSPGWIRAGDILSFASK